MQLNFKTLSFVLKEESLRVNLLNIFYCQVPVKEMDKIGFVGLVDQQTLEFNNKKAETKFSFLLTKYFNKLRNSINGNNAVYLHQNSTIPLLGHVGIGIVYRNSSLIEVKPITSCNLNCIFCSVGEGPSSDKTDFVVEKDYLVEEFRKIVTFVDEPVEAHIGTQGEPTLYADLIPLIADLNEMEMVETVSVDTNGILLTKEMIDKMSQYKKLRLNLSLHSLDKGVAKQMAGGHYNLNHVLSMVDYAQGKVKIMLTPLLVPSYNDEGIEDLVKFAKKKGLRLGIQNFLKYKTGRNPVKPWPWPKFYSLLKDLEEKYKIKLVVTPEDFSVKKTKILPKPFVKDDLVKARIMVPDRFPGTSIAVVKDRMISVVNQEFVKEKNVKIKLLRDKHNIFVGKVV